MLINVGMAVTSRHVNVFLISPTILIFWFLFSGCRCLHLHSCSLSSSAWFVTSLNVLVSSAKIMVVLSISSGRSFMKMTKTFHVSP